MLTGLTSTPAQLAPAAGSLIHRLSLRPPALPNSLAGLTILHLSDLHVRRPRKRYEKLLAELAALPDPPDLLALTGDYMCRIGDEPIAYEMLKRILHTVQPRIGAFGVFGNHDSPAMRRRVDHLPVHWLGADQPWCGGGGDEPHADKRANDLCLIGVDCGFCNYDADLLQSLLGRSVDPQHPRFSIALSHLPHYLPGIADAGIDLLLAGHTHGGQCRLPGGVVLHGGYGDWPLRLCTGVLRMRNTLAVINRGLGEAKMDGLRLFCPPHALLITLEAPQAMSHTAPPPTADIATLIRW